MFIRYLDNQLSISKENNYVYAKKIAFCICLNFGFVFLLVGFGTRYSKFGDV